jgi:scytalone dehydratase
LKLDSSEQPLPVKHKLTADQFVKLSNNENRLGGIVDCTHHVGASKFERIGPDTVTGHHQVFFEYKRYKNMEKKNDEVEATGEGLTIMLHYYQKVDGKWKLAGVKPRVRMSQFNFPEILKEPQQKDTKKSKL